MSPSPTRTSLLLSCLLALSGVAVIGCGPVIRVVSNGGTLQRSEIKRVRVVGAMASVQLVEQQAHSTFGWRTTGGDDGTQVLIDVNLEIVVDRLGRAIRVAPDDGELFVVDSAGEQWGVDIDADIRASAHIGSSSVGMAAAQQPEMTASNVGGWRGVPSSGGAALLVDANAQLVLTEEGDPINIAPTGDLYVAAGDVRYALDSTEELVARARIDVQVDIHIDLEALAGFLTMKADDGAHVLVNADGEVLLDDTGRAVRVDYDGRPFVIDGAVHVDLDLDVAAVADLVATARIDVDINASIGGSDVQLAGLGGGASGGGVSDVSAGGVSSAGATGTGMAGGVIAAGPAGPSAPNSPSVGVDTSSGGAGSIQIGADVHVSIAAAGRPGFPAEHVGGRAGVRAVGRGRATFQGLMSGEIQVDGYRLGLGDLGPIASLAGGVDQSSVVPTSPAIIVQAELEHATLPQAGGETSLVVQLEGGQAPSSAQTNVRLHLVIDRSSSMQSTWGEVLGAAELLIGELNPGDSIQIVAYGTTAQEVLPLTRVGNGRSALRALEAIDVGGGTNIQVGLESAYRSALSRPLQGNERSLVMLLSDGVPNGGAFTADELAPMAEHARSAGGATTTVIGLGNQFDPVVLRALANAGQGNYHIARGTSDLAPVLRAELRTQQRISARDIQVRVELPSGVELISGGEMLADGSALLTLPQIRQGEQRRLDMRLRIPEGFAAGQLERSVAQLEVDYRDGARSRTARKDIRVRFGAEAQLSSAAPTFVLADKDLGQTLDLAANAVLNGQTRAAVNALQAHVARMHARPDFELHANLSARTEAASRFAQALQTITPRANHTERRVFSLAMGELAAQLLR